MHEQPGGDELQLGGCDQTGMRINIKKSACFTITPCWSKTYTVNLQVEAICIRGEAVPVIPPDGSMKYLGSKMSPWVTKIRKDLVAQLESWMKSIGEAETEAEADSCEPLSPGKAELPSDVGHLPHVHPTESRSGSTHCRKELGKTPRMFTYHNVLLK